MPKICTLLGLLLGCRAVVAAGEVPAIAARIETPIIRPGLCDASAAAAIDAARFIVGGDEENSLLVFRRGVDAPPEQSFDMSLFLQADPRHPEADIEAAAGIGDRIYWITSHGRNRAGELRASRYRFWAIDIVSRGKQIALRPFGRPYVRLLDDLLGTESLRSYDLAGAATRAVRDAGALNIEGLAATPEGELLIGFRNPLAGNRAILLPLRNPAAVVKGEKARFGSPMEIELGGRGIRSIDYWPARKTYAIVAGPAGDDRLSFQLYLWPGSAGENPQPVADLDFGDLHPEAIVLGPDDRSLLLVCDDGARQIDGDSCKDLAPERQKFRTVAVTLDAPSDGQ